MVNVKVQGAGGSDGTITSLGEAIAVRSQVRSCHVDTFLDTTWFQHPWVTPDSNGILFGENMMVTVLPG